MDNIEVAQAPIKLLDVLDQFKLVDSRSDGKRLIEQGAITIDGVKIQDKGHEILDIPPRGLIVMRSRRRRIWLQPKYGNDLWDVKIERNGKLDFGIEHIINGVVLELDISPVSKTAW